MIFQRPFLGCHLYVTIKNACINAFRQGTTISCSTMLSDQPSSAAGLKPKNHNSASADFLYMNDLNEKILFRFPKAE